MPHQTNVDLFLTIAVIGGVVMVITGWVYRFIRRNIMPSQPPVRSKRTITVLPGTVALEPLSPAQFGPPPNWYANRAEPTIDLVMLGEVDRDTLIDILSVLKKDGEYLLSANKILELVGGTATDVKTRVASHRPKPPAPKVKPHLDRPVSGW